MNCPLHASAVWAKSPELWRKVAIWAIAAVENGFCEKNTDISVRVDGGELIVHYTDERVLLTGNAETVFEGVFEY